MALYAVRPYIALLVAETGGGSIAVGLIAAAYSLVQVILAIFAGRWIDKLGARRPAVYGATVFLLGAIGLTSIKNLFFIAVSSFLLGISHLLALLSAQYVVTGLYSNLRNKIMGVYVFVNSVGMFAGSYVGGYFQDWLGTGKGFYGAVGIGIVCWICSLFMPKDVQIKGCANKGAVIQLLGNDAVLRNLTVSSIVQFTSEMTVSYLPLYGRDLGLSNAAIGTIFGVNGFAIMLVRPLLNTIISFLNRERIMRICLLFGGLSLACYSLTGEYTLLIILAGISGIAVGLMAPLTLMAVTDAAPKNRRSQVLALRLMGNYIAQTVSPMAFGLLASVMGISPMFLFSGACMSLSAALVNNKETVQSNYMSNRR
jgi:MFS family permease